MSKLARRLRSFTAPPALNQRLFLKSLIYLWFFRLAVWVLPYRQIRCLENRTQTWTNPVTPRVDPQELAHVLMTASRYVPRTTCLIKALAGSYLFTGQGHTVQLVIGAHITAEKFEAHAWLESGGRVVLGGVNDLKRYRPLS